MVEFMAVAFIAVGVIEEIVLPVGSQAVDTAMWAANQAYARVDMLVN